MKISAKTYYGLKALTRLASSSLPISAKEIAQAENIPLPYLGKIFQSLRQSGFVASQRGIKGGYTLMHAPQDISLSDIFTELEGPFFSIPCLGGSSCPMEKTCQTKDSWYKINRGIDTYLSTITLQNIIEHQ
ncbi:MAG: Rrf2 family transcriptional regulator [Candidatus Moranbacteria bacterium]|nr:Rrf2 family transcriptional regulator [Candidatus Moranbacteria bacterium]